MTTSRRARAAALAVLATAALTACAAPITPVGGETVDEAYHVIRVDWTDGSVFRVAMRLREANGSAVLCGAVADSTVGRGDNTIALTMQSYTNVRHRGRLLISTLEPFAGPYRVQSLAGKEANCADTGRPWSPDMADPSGFGLTIPRTVGDG